MSHGLTSYAVFSRATGEIVATAGYAHGAEGAEYQRAALEAAWPPDTHGVVAAEADPARHYVVTLRGRPTLANRPEMPARADRTVLVADGVDEIVLTGLPDPCTVTVDADDPDVETTVVEVTGGGFALTAETPGDYTVEAAYFPFRPWRIVFTATAPE